MECSSMHLSPGAVQRKVETEFSSLAELIGDRTIMHLSFLTTSLHLRLLFLYSPVLSLFIHGLFSPSFAFSPLPLPFLLFCISSFSSIRKLNFYLSFLFSIVFSLFRCLSFPLSFLFFLYLSSLSFVLSLFCQSFLFSVRLFFSSVRLFFFPFAFSLFPVFFSFSFSPFSIVVPLFFFSLE